MNKWRFVYANGVYMNTFATNIRTASDNEVVIRPKICQILITYCHYLPYWSSMRACNPMYMPSNLS